MNAPADLRLPPHSVEAEQALLGCLLIDGRAWDRIADLITDADFYRDDHRRIFRHLGKLIQAGRPADVVTVFESIEASNESEQTGGLGYLGEIANATPSAANVRRYAEIVRERAVRRAVVMAAESLASAAMNSGGQDAEALVQAAEEELARILDRGGDEPVTADQAMSAVLADADDRQRSGHPAGLDTGIDGLDRLTGGLVPGQLFVLGARPSVGKTAVALGIAAHVAQAGGRCTFFSLEMTRQEIAGRLLAMRSGVPLRSLRRGPTTDEWDQLAPAPSGEWGARLVIDDRPAATVAYVRARCRRLHRQSPLALIVVDYLQLMSTPDELRTASRTVQVGSLSRGLKTLAKELGVPIIALAQLNRESENRPDRRPQLSDLRDSGEIEQDADLIGLLSRVAEASATENAIIELALRKHRNGPCGDTLLTFDAKSMTFHHYTGARPSARAARRGLDD